jgi:hypothetical protein
MTNNESDLTDLDDILHQAGIGIKSNPNFSNSVPPLCDVENKYYSTLNDSEKKMYDTLFGSKNAETKHTASSEVKKPKDIVLISLSDWATARLKDIEPRVKLLECKCFNEWEVIDNDGAICSLRENLVPFAKNYYRRNPAVEQAYVFPAPYYITSDIMYCLGNRDAPVIPKKRWSDLVGGLSDFRLCFSGFCGGTSTIRRHIEEKSILNDLIEIPFKRFLFIPYFVESDFLLDENETKFKAYKSKIGPTKGFYERFSTSDNADIAKLMPAIQQSLLYVSL